MDSPESDDGAIHALYQTVPLDELLDVLRALLVLSRVRGRITPEQRARAQALADDPRLQLGEHPVIARILGAP